jgi:hypothetical protein
MLFLLYLPLIDIDVIVLCWIWKQSRWVLGYLINKLNIVQCVKSFHTCIEIEGMKIVDVACVNKFTQTARKIIYQRNSYPSRE